MSQGNFFLNLLVGSPDYMVKEKVPVVIWTCVCTNASVWKALLSTSILCMNPRTQWLPSEDCQTVSWPVPSYLSRINADFYQVASIASRCRVSVPDCSPTAQSAMPCYDSIFSEINQSRKVPLTSLCKFHIFFLSCHIYALPVEKHIIYLIEVLQFKLSPSLASEWP